MFKAINKQSNIKQTFVKQDKPANKAAIPAKTSIPANKLVEKQVKTEKSVKTDFPANKADHSEKPTLTRKIKRIINKITRKNQIVNIFDDFIKSKSWKKLDRSRSGFDKSANTEQLGKSIYNENCSYYEISGLLGNQKRDAMGKVLFTPGDHGGQLF